MIKATFTPLKISINGHSYHGMRTGADGDVVCAAVSGIVATWVNGLPVMFGDGVKFNLTEGDGYTEIEFAWGSEVGAYVDVLQNGLENIAEEYPEEVTVFDLRSGGVNYAYEVAQMYQWASKYGWEQEQIGFDIGKVLEILKDERRLII